MRTPKIALTTVIFVAGACSSVSDGVGARVNTAISGPAPWQGLLSDRMNQASRAPATPALRALKGRTPLVYLTRAAARNVVAEPSYELAVFDDGTLVYEGHRCVRLGGVVLERLAPDELVQVRDLLAALCVDFEGSNEGELCDDAVVLRVACANGPLACRGSDRCRREDARGRRIEALRSALVEQLNLSSWLGEPTTRQACALGALDLAPHELARTITLDLPEI